MEGGEKITCSVRDCGQIGYVFWLFKLFLLKMGVIWHFSNFNVEETGCARTLDTCSYRTWLAILSAE